MIERLITIVGPTAVGKTDATLFLAEKLGSPVLSGDAYQVYRGLNIGSAKPSAEELSRVHHDLIDIRSPFESYHVADFQEEARNLILRYNEEGKIPILSGGTGLYVQSLLEGYAFSAVEKDEELRAYLDKLWNEKGQEGLLSYATELAKKEGITLPFTDKHRLFRAIELLLAGDVETLRSPSKNGLSYEGPVIGLIRDRKELYDRINLRVDLMVKAGLFEEVEALCKEGLTASHTSMKGIGYKEIFPYFEGHISKEVAIDLIKKNTRHFAKRQLTWYRRMPYIYWITISEDMTNEDVQKAVLRYVESELHDY